MGINGLTVAAGGQLLPFLARAVPNLSHEGRRSFDDLGIAYLGRKFRSRDLKIVDRKKKTVVRRDELILVERF